MDTFLVTTESEKTVPYKKDAIGILDARTEKGWIMCGHCMAPVMFKFKMFTVTLNSSE